MLATLNDNYVRSFDSWSLGGTRSGTTPRSLCLFVPWVGRIFDKRLDLPKTSEVGTIKSKCLRGTPERRVGIL